MKTYTEKRRVVWHPGKVRGLSLIELMIAIGLGMVVVGALLALFVNVTRANNEMSKMNRQIENGRFAIQIMQSDLAHAGFWGDYIPEFEDRNVAAPGDVPATEPDPCLAQVSWTPAHVSNLIGIPVQSGIGTCGVVTSQQADTDVLVVRHAEPIPPTPGSACAGGNVCFQASQCALEINAVPARRFVLGTGGFDLEEKDCTDAAAGAITVATATVRRFISNIYYVRNDFTLMRSEYLNGAHQAAQPLIDGIEALRIEYGIDSLGKNGAAVSYTGAVNRGDGIPDGDYVSAGDLTCNNAADCDAANIVAVRIHVLARSTEVTPGYTDTKTYVMGGTGNLGPFNDGFKRHVFTTTVRLVNPSGRRETP